MSLCHFLDNNSIIEEPVIMQGKLNLNLSKALSFSPPNG